MYGVWSGVYVSLGGLLSVFKGSFPESAFPFGVRYGICIYFGVISWGLYFRGFRFGNCIFFTGSCLGLNLFMLLLRLGMAAEMRSHRCLVSKLCSL